MKTKNPIKHIPIHESLMIGILLAIVGGYLDTYTYITRGGVFANAQTGNMVLMSILLAQGQFVKAIYYLIPITAFFLGVLVTEWIKRTSTALQLTRWEHIIILIELILLLIIGFLPFSVPNAVINVTISFICSMQVNSFRKTKGLPYATTMCTGNLRSSAEHFFIFLSERDPSAGKKCLRYFIIILFFCIGAGAGAVCTTIWAEKSVWGCCVLLFAVLLIFLLHKREKRA